MPSRSATWAAGHSSTSRRISRARCRAGRYCRAATMASRMPARPRPPRPDRAPGRRQRAAASASGSGCSHGRSSDVTRGAGVVRRRTQARGQRPGAALDRGQARVGGDPVQPGPDRRPALERAVGAPRAQVGLLHQVFGFLGRAEHPVAVRQQLAPELAGQGGEVVGGCRGPRGIVADGPAVSVMTVGRYRSIARPGLTGPRPRAAPIQRRRWRAGGPRWCARARRCCGAGPAGPRSSGLPRAPGRGRAAA